MSSRHLVDPQLLPLLELMPPYQAISKETLPVLRERVDELADLQLEAADMTGVGIAVERIERTGGPPVRLVLYRPESLSGPAPAVLHVHGGGMVIGRPEMRHANLVTMARTLQCVVASVDYRLAPEAPFPAALEDCYAALVWLRDRAADLDVDPARLAVAGESAGGGIAAGLALFARDNNGPAIVAQMLTYPMLDDRTGWGKDRPFAGEFVWGAAGNRFCWQALLGEQAGSSNVPYYAAPARAQKLEGLPPAFIAVGALDLFLDENLDFAHRLIRAGVSTELHVYPGAFHAFDGATDAAVTQNFKRDWFAALTRLFARNPA
jgi:triacylglycerol lipase